jgi:hypothetical protein
MDDQAFSAAIVDEFFEICTVDFLRGVSDGSVLFVRLNLELLAS